jgi:hypothetical protein
LCICEVLFSLTLRPTAEELNRYKFSGVTLGGLSDLPDQLISLEQLFTTSLLLPRETQVVPVAYTCWAAVSAFNLEKIFHFTTLLLLAAWYTNKRFILAVLLDQLINLEQQFTASLLLLFGTQLAAFWTAYS